jgi:hypothetical protein
MICPQILNYVPVIEESKEAEPNPKKTEDKKKLQNQDSRISNNPPISNTFSNVAPIVNNN